MCAWNNHFCWPGSCGSNGLTHDCTCAPGFRKVSSFGADIHSGETTCQPTQAPTITTCDTVVVGPTMNQKRAISTTSSSACFHLQDIYGNFQLTQIKFNMTSEFAVETTSITNKPKFVVEAQFGISDSTVYINQYGISGEVYTLC